MSIITDESVNKPKYVIKYKPKHLNEYEIKLFSEASTAIAFMEHKLEEGFDANMSRQILLNET